MKNYAELIERLRAGKTIKRVAVVAAEDEHTLEAVMMAVCDGLVTPVLIGNLDWIETYLTRSGYDKDSCVIIPAANDEDAAWKAITAINKGEADFIIKGRLETSILLKAIVNKDSGMRTGRIMSHVTLVEMATYHKILALTDVAMVTYPDLDQKKQLIENAIEVLHKLGLDMPKVAIISATEKVNPKLIESIDADRLKQMNQAGELSGCLVEGPISYDLAINQESVDIKGYESPVASDADLIVVPNLTAGNLLVKSLIFSGRCKAAGIVVGAKVPIVLTSRSSPTADKYMSIILAAAACPSSQEGASR